MTRRLVLAGAVAAMVAGVGVFAYRAGTRHDPPAAHPVATSTAVITRGSILQRSTQQGTLTYSDPITVDDQAAGTYTALPQPGAVLRRDQAGYEVNGAPVWIMYGARPAWRAFAPGMSDGPDVLQLERNLRALGDDPDHAMTIDDHYSWNTEVAIEHWQDRHGLTETGTIPLGSILFLPSAMRVSAVSAVPGQAAAPGTTVATGTCGPPIVTAQLATQSGVRPAAGQHALVTLPSGAMVTGRVSQVDPPTAASSSNNAGSGSNNGSDSSQSVVPVTVSLPGSARVGQADDAPVQVQFTIAEHDNVLTAPSTALLATSGGGYAVEVVTDTGHRLVPVTTGLFDDESGRAEITGAGLAPGVSVEVPAS